MSKKKPFEHEIDPELLAEIEAWEPQEHDEPEGYYFSNPDPYLKPTPLPPDHPRHNFWFDEDGHIRVKNPSAFWLPEFTLQKEIGGTVYTVTGSYDGTEPLNRKMERIMGESPYQSPTDMGVNMAGYAIVDDDACRDAARLEIVRRYFAGRADVTSFTVAEHVLSGRRDEALGALRWALETGVPPVLVTSALASSLRSQGRYSDLAGARLREGEVAAAVGVPPWKVKDLVRHARDWTPRGLATALQLVARADAAVKGAASDPEVRTSCCGHGHPHW